MRDVAAMTEKLPTWNLSDLYKSFDDPKIDKDLKKFKKQAEEFEKKYKSTIATSKVTAKHLKTVLDEYCKLLSDSSKPAEYAELLFSTKTKEAKVGALLQRTREAGSSIAKHFVFLELEIGKIPRTTYTKISKEKSLELYKHYLDHQRELAVHQLTESEEKILVETANSRGSAFARLFSEVTSRATYPLQRNGKREEMTQSEILTLLYEPERETRKAAASGITEGLKENSHVCTYIYNTLLQEKSVLDRLRSFQHPESSRHVANELKKEVVDTMTKVVVKNYDIVADYYTLKKKLLGLSELKDYDRYAPIAQSQSTVSYSEAKQMVLEAFGKFSPKLAKITEPFFDKNWIDAAPADGKQGGAFCAGVAPDLHPYVFMNFMGKSRDLMTLAHELGHGIHAQLSSRNPILYYQAVLPLCETASTFGEALVFDLLMERLDDPKEKLALLCGKIEDSFATIFRQIAMFRFEQRAHSARREEGELPTERLSELWQTSMQEMFGASLTLTENHAWWWLYIPHIMHVPFYVYAYAFGELFVFSLYAQYQREGKPFVEKYFEFLASGSSKSPEKLVKGMGFQIDDPNFWQGGCDLVRERVEQAKALAKSISR
ncbi:M3 family oligoendopeptidase [Candidatus Acetothermia bacterium]|nr:M3 family oligoendopeptidase [Candidatus Acetothermia bacterium]MBI3643108.1 M3 family oligoendopeptidase [Candidatus Acetothermia bacterium]